MPYTLIKIQKEGYNTPSQKQRLLHAITESKGRQQLFMKQSPETLDRLLESAMIESVRASTAMEGVVVPEQKRLMKMLKSSQWKPINRDEEDILAYKNALKSIYQNKEWAPPILGLFEFTERNVHYL